MLHRTADDRIGRAPSDCVTADLRSARNARAFKKGRGRRNDVKNRAKKLLRSSNTALSLSSGCDLFFYILIIVSSAAKICETNMNSMSFVAYLPRDDDAAHGGEVDLAVGATACSARDRGPAIMPAFLGARAYFERSSSVLSVFIS
jgi:hypothetical protein